MRRDGARRPETRDVAGTRVLTLLPAFVARDERGSETRKRNGARSASIDRRGLRPVADGRPRRGQKPMDGEGVGRRQRRRDITDLQLEERPEVEISSSLEVDERQEGSGHGDVERLVAGGLLRRVKRIGERHCGQIPLRRGRVTGPAKRCEPRSREQPATWLQPSCGESRRGGEKPRGRNGTGPWHGLAEAQRIRQRRGSGHTG